MAKVFMILVLMLEFLAYANMRKKMKVFSFEPEPNSFVELYNVIILNNLDIVPIKLP